MDRWLKVFVVLVWVSVLGGGAAVTFAASKPAKKTPAKTSVKKSPVKNKAKPKAKLKTPSQSSGPATKTTASGSWKKGLNGWESVGKVPDCPSPLTLQTPIDLSILTSILYPGQYRGNQYKPHGGFAFADNTNDQVTVKAPLEAVIDGGARYNQSGEVQYLFDFIHPCGLMYRFDHLRTLSLRLQAIAETFPAPTESSFTTTLRTVETVTEGEVLSTSVGFIKDGNTGVDFGVYDLRQKNKSAGDSAWAAIHSSDLEQHALCWFDLLPAADAARVKALPARGIEGKTSDYCP